MIEIIKFNSSFRHEIKKFLKESASDIERRSGPGRRASDSYAAIVEPRISNVSAYTRSKPAANDSPGHPHACNCCARPTDNLD